ncbi:MAG: hypothetical protein ABJG14_04855 [Sulfitobacter sp.]|uniref:hypothetical protein n=1 Tax=Alphaproteobacteria TaxID=28211 RepID=UPI0032641E39
MNVFVVFDAPSVQIAGDNDPVELDLIAHFVGLVEPDNVNAAPVVRKPPEIKQHVTGHVLIFPETRQAAQRVLDREAHIHEAYMRALSKQLRLLRSPETSKNKDSQLFEKAPLSKEDILSL